MTMTEPRWIAVDEIGNDNFATSIYEAGYDGLLVARCNQNGQYPWQGPAIIRGLEQNKSIAALAPEQEQSSPPARQENDDVFKGFRGNNEA